MRLLLDTHILIWIAAEPGSLPFAVRQILADAEQELLFSVASIWEIAIKSALRRSSFTVDPARLRRGLLFDGYTELGISGEHALQVSTLPPIHKDPFDRILVAQAMAEGLLLVTADKEIAKYPGPIRLV